jgi:DNA polymerase V
MKYVGLADCNNFFVSCERVFRPDLWGKPVVVLSSNDGAVVARSEEVKKLGVPMGVPYFKVRDIFEKNHVAVFSSNFDLYRDISDRVMNTLRAEVEDMEQYSVDEAFFEMEVKSVAPAKKEMERLRDLLYKNLGVPVSFGLAPTKTIAKYANGLEKRKSGVSILTKADWKKLTPEVPLSELWGVGAAMSKRFREHSLISVADLLAADPTRVSKLFGIYGLRLLAELSGEKSKGQKDEDDLPKTIMSTRAFSKTTEELSVLEEALAYHVSRAAEELRAKEAVAGRLAIMILTSRHSDWFLKGGTGESLLPEPTSDTTVLLREAKRLAKEIFEVGVPYKKAGIVLGNIQSKGFSQINLFGNSVDNTELMRAVDTLNKKLGPDSVTIGRAKYKEGWTNRHDYRSKRYTTSWNELKTIK